jgi:hypothetical protein
MQESVLKHQTTMYICLPKREKYFGMNDKSLHLTLTNNDLYDFWNCLENEKDVDTLYCVLQKVAQHEKWQEYLDVDLTFFQWTFNDMVLYSCNPFFELFMRCTAKLFSLFNDLANGTHKMSTEEMDILISQINFALNGMYSFSLNTQETSNCPVKLYQPALFAPPLWREEHTSRTHERGIEIAIGLSTNMIQIIIYLILAERWMNMLQDNMWNIFQNRKSSMNDEFINNMTINHTQQIISYLYSISREILTDTFGVFDDNQKYHLYISKRFDPSNNNSDLSRLAVLFRVWTCDLSYIHHLEKKMIKSISSGYHQDVYQLLRKYFKFYPGILHCKNKVQNAPIRLYENTNANDFHDLATEYKFGKVYELGKNMEVSKVKSLERNIPLPINSCMNEQSETEFDQSEYRKKKIYCFMCV